ncbi:hypothetical protein Rsub_03561 [Raphidocelis subcapitata]|uniref:Amino acid transporter transmembrane domain-containing protein n=1 Tax=Raphidocelis subcapitata TaxID=307507 RepID=A0A2V0NUC8_9CHLO|nr:hypothetical protein Rsub_03561 [Raphidocelis subcapitata]|eukprot:GBF91241.1 hypothetical protein Rsub_03561 [Raphidocelis subcapitata]
MDLEEPGLTAPLLVPARAAADEAGGSGDGDGAGAGAGAADAPLQQQREGRRRGAHWLAIAVILTTDMVGIGTLGLPADFARLGWLPALACLALFIAGGVYSGSVYQRLALRVPRAVVFDEIGSEAMGKLGRALVFGTIYLGILTEPCIFHLMTVESLRQALSHIDLSRPAAHAIVVALILPLAQVHHLEDVAWVAIFGTAAMILAIGIVVAKLAATYLAASAAGAAGAAALAAAAAAASAPGAPLLPQPSAAWLRRPPRALAAVAAPGGAAPAAGRAATEWVASGSFYAAMVGVVDIAFSFGGQINWMRYITDIGDRSKFSRAVTLTEAIMGSLYLLTGVVGYAALGKDMDVRSPISSVLPFDGWMAAANAGVFLHCLVAYQVMVNVWSSSLLHIASSRSGSASTESGSGGASGAGGGAHDGGARRRLVWLCVTCGCVAFSTAAVWAFPFFSEMMGIIASLGDIMSMFGLPCIFAVRLLKLGRAETALCWALAALAVALSGAGLVSSAQQLAEALGGGGGGVRR